MEERRPRERGGALVKCSSTPPTGHWVPFLVGSVRCDNRVCKHSHQIQYHAKVRWQFGLQAIFPQPRKPPLLTELDVTSEDQMQRRKIDTPILCYTVYRCS